MTTNKPEVVAHATHHDEPMLFPSSKEAAAYCEDGEEPVALIRLCDYEALQSERDKLRAELETVKKVAYGNLELLDENAKLRAEVEALRALLGKSLPVVEAHAGASHMLEGFRPTRNKWDELVDGIRVALAAKEA